MGSASRGAGLGFHVGLKHHAPGEAWWDAERGDLGELIVSDIQEYGLPYFEQVRTPERLVEILRDMLPADTPFNAGGPEVRVKMLASLLYLFESRERGLAFLDTAITDGSFLGFAFRRPQDLAEFQAFLRAGPDIPVLPLSP